jgi:hypothetical protein
VLAWQILDSYDGSKSAHLLEMALKRISGSKSKKCHLRLVVDGGGENNNRHIEALEKQGHFEKQIALFQISFSNSMIEALFRSLKHNHLFSQDIKNLKSLKKHSNFWFT